MFSFDLLSNKEFVKAFMYNKFRFLNIYIHNPNNAPLTKYGEEPPWDSEPRYEADASDIKREFKIRLKKFYEPMFGYGVVLTLCIVTSPVGLALLLGGSLILPFDSLVTFIDYNIKKRKIKK